MELSYAMCSPLFSYLLRSGVCREANRYGFICWQRRRGNKQVVETTPLSVLAVRRRSDREPCQSTAVLLRSFAALIAFNQKPVAPPLCSHARGCVQVLWKCCSLARTVTSRGVLKCSRASRHSKLSIMLTHCQRLRSLPHCPSDLQVNTPPGVLARSPRRPHSPACLSSRELAYY